MLFFRGTFVTVAAVAVLALTGCDDPLNPCPIETFVNSDFLDGTWNAELINGKAIPPSGFKADDKNFVKAATMEFHTTRADGKCIAPTTMSGVVIFRYKLLDELGLSKDSKSYMATFDYDIKPGDLTFRIDTEVAPGERIAPKVLTVDPVLPRGWTPMSLVFTR
jgi:hypothetical protein